MDRWEREMRDLTKTQVSAIIWTILLTWLRTKNGGCVSHDEKKKYKIQNNKKINVYVVMLLFLFEIKSMDLIKWGFIFNFLVIAPKIYSYLLLNKDFSQCFITENIGMTNSESSVRPQPC